MNPILRCDPWRALAEDAMTVRRAVFIDEQGVPEALEMDGLDERDDSHHCVAYLDNRPVATGRLLANGKIGRLCVLQTWRGQGLGARVLRKLVQLGLAEIRLPSLYLHAQSAALGFYEQWGFVAEGAVFDEAGIPHRRMRFQPRDSVALLRLFADDVMRFDDEARAIWHMTRLCECGRRSIDLLSHHLPPSRFTPELCDAISALARGYRQAQVRILVQDTQHLAGSSHPLLQLTQRLSSRISLRRLMEAPRRPGEGYLIVDRQRLVFFNDEANALGFANYRAKAEAEHQLDDFERLWRYQSETDPNLARLHI